MKLVKLQTMNENVNGLINYDEFTMKTCGCSHNLGNSILRVATAVWVLGIQISSRSESQSQIKQRCLFASRIPYFYYQVVLYGILVYWFTIAQYHKVHL